MTWLGNSKRRPALVLFALLVLALAGPFGAVARAAAQGESAVPLDTSSAQEAPVPAASPDPVAFSAGGPAGVVNVSLGTTIDTEIRVTNESGNAAVFNLEVVTLKPEENGKLQLADQPNVFTNAVQTAKTVRIDGRTAQRVVARIAVPARVDPDTYFVGVAVSAQPEGGGTAQVLRIVAPITLRVPSGESSALRATFHNSRIVWGRKVAGSYDLEVTRGSSATVERSLRIERMGKAVAPGEHHGGPSELLLTGKKKNFDWKATLPATHIGLARPRLDATYVDETDQRVTAHFNGGWILIVTPLGVAVAILVLAVLVAAGWLGFRAVRRRRRSLGRYEKPLKEVDQ